MKNYEDFSLRDYNSDCIKNLRHLGIHYPSPRRYRLGVRPPSFYPAYPASSSPIHFYTRLHFLVRNVPGKMAADLVSVHIDLEEEIDGFFDAESFIPLFVRHLTSLQSFTLNKLIRGKGEWSKSRYLYKRIYDDHWFIRSGGDRSGMVKPFILQMNHLFGVKGRQEFEVLPNDLIQRMTAGGVVDPSMHWVIERWTWKAKTGEVLKQSNYFNKLCEEAHDGPCKRELLEKDKDISGVTILSRLDCYSLFAIHGS
ncbi:hypothetical protein HYALB_00009866 [Hymenoscyphus albidus]|uniref:Uncharacterized protein n=1 Tax=Hymenoscyphus albidus TaxID=595503 RepID=A0A9N9L9H8_9HELO|nr:hypothetical protein HYALB_00009866 [Hymenoscyphus albidus]